MAENYEVTSQRQTTAVGPDGRFTQVVEVAFKTRPSGIILTEDVPLDRYNAAYVDQVLTERAGKAEEIASL